MEDTYEKVNNNMAILLLLALNCEAAAPLQLSGTGGQTILALVASTNVTNQITKASVGEPWNWGHLPWNKVIDKNGKIHDQVDDAGSENDNLWQAAKSNELGGLNLTVYA